MGVIAGLAAALVVGGDTHTVSDVLNAIHNGDAQMWEDGKAFIVTQIVEHPRCRVVQFWLATGELEDVLILSRKIYKWAEEMGCDRAVMLGRKGWTRALREDGWTPTMVSYQRKLSNGREE